MNKKYIRPEIKDYIDMGLRVPNYLHLTPNEYHYLQEKCKHEKYMGGVCVKCDYHPFCTDENGKPVKKHRIACPMGFDNYFVTGATGIK